MPGPGHFHARQLLLAERSKRTTQPQLTSSPSEHPSLHTIITVAPQPLEHTPSTTTTESPVSESHGAIESRFNRIIDLLVRLVMFPIFLSCCTMVWLRYELCEFQLSQCYKTGYKWVHKSDEESKKKKSKNTRGTCVWILMTPVLVLRVVIKMISSPAVYMNKRRDKKRSGYIHSIEGGVGVLNKKKKKPCPYTKLLMSLLHPCLHSLYTLIGIHLTTLRLGMNRFEDTHDLWSDLKGAWWSSVMKLVQDRNAPFVGQLCLLVPD